MMKVLITMFFAQASALQLTPETWDTTLSGKTAFLKFFAPWCGHCKKMKPAWDKLMEKYADSDNVVIADVDCVGDGKPLCDKAGVKGFPTIKFGDPKDLEDYKGQRDFESLDTFSSLLKPPCNVDTFEHCTDEEKVLVDELGQKSPEELKDLLGSEEDERLAVEKTFEEAVKRLNEEYKEILSEKEKDLSSIQKRYNVGILKKILERGTSEL